MGGKGGGSILGRFAGWCGNMVVGFVVVGAVLVAVVGASSTAALYKTGAVITGTSTGITFAALPKFFGSVKDGQALVNLEPAAKTTTKKGS